MSYTIRHTEKIAALLLVIFAIVVFIETADYRTGPSADPGAAFFPRMIATLLALMGVFQLVQTYRTGETRTFEVELPVAKRVLGAVLAPILYLLVLPVAGFLVSTVAFLVGFMYYAGARSPGKMTGSAVGITLLLFYIFGSIFHVPLPEGIVPISRLLPSLPIVIGGI